jgi:pyruvate dehydrogenase E2 component (dihydrolipoamide acetyltransferase)
MAELVVMPKQGNTVESCIIVEWFKAVGDQVAVGEALCGVETDKATLEVESTSTGTVLALFFEEGDDVPVMTPIAAIGEPNEDVSDLRPVTDAQVPARGSPLPMNRNEQPVATEAQTGETAVSPTPTQTTASQSTNISPRARLLAQQKGLEIVGIQGSGPAGRIIERDIVTAHDAQPRITPVAKRMLAQGELIAPEKGTGTGGRITSKDLMPKIEKPVATSAADEVEIIPLKGIRKVIAERMLHSLQTTAQLTLNASADARALLAYRQRLKNSDDSLGVQHITINDLILFAVSRTLVNFPGINALFINDAIHQYQDVHLAFAVDTPRGLMVPVMRRANQLSLKQITDEAKRLAADCQNGRIAPDDLSGGTFTVSNLGAFGIEHFTPILNPPQVGILGVSNINLKPIDSAGEIQFIPHMGLSLTINHQVVDGVPGARFLQTLSQQLANFELLLAQ